MMSKVNTSLGNLMNEKGRFPSQAQHTVKGQNHIECTTSGDKNMEDVKAITTLRSGREVNNKVEKTME